MNEQEILKIESLYTESKIQHICVCWFRKTFPDVAGLLIAIPNGGYRDPTTAAMMVYEGQWKGASDLILLYPSGGKSALCIEMKVPKRPKTENTTYRAAGKQKPEQKAWQSLVESHGSVYSVCHGLMEFIDAVCLYLKTNPTPYKEKALRLYPTYR